MTSPKTSILPGIFNFALTSARDRTSILTSPTGSQSRDKQFRLSELMNSVLLFFPRTFVPAIADAGRNAVVTLPTGERVEFDAKTHEIVSGVFAERPVTLSAPQFPAVDYVGKGVTVRANSRGKDPRIGTVATITTGSPDPHCNEGQRCNQCQVPAQELWQQNGARCVSSFPPTSNLTATCARAAASAYRSRTPNSCSSPLRLTQINRAMAAVRIP